MTDWTDPAKRPVNKHGSKARVGGHPKSAYSDWRRTIGHGCYANDIDWVEWRRDGETPTIVAIIETTLYEDKPEMRHLLPSYCRCALDRFKRDGQGTITRMVAEKLGVPAFLVIARYDLQQFWVCRLSDEVWRTWDQASYRAWLHRLHRR